MKKANQKGFSLIEMLVVVTIIGIIAALAIPYLKKAIYASENGAIFATVRSMYSEQLSFLGTKSRFARLDELNAISTNQFGSTLPGNKIKRGNFTFEMIPSVPTDAELKTEFQIKVTKTLDSADLPYVIKLTHKGEIEQITP